MYRVPISYRFCHCWRGGLGWFDLLGQTACLLLLQFLVFWILYWKPFRIFSIFVITSVSLNWHWLMDTYQFCTKTSKLEQKVKESDPRGFQGFFFSMLNLRLFPSMLNLRLEIYWQVAASRNREWLRKHANKSQFWTQKQIVKSLISVQRWLFVIPLKIILRITAWKGDYFHAVILS